MNKSIIYKEDKDIQEDLRKLKDLQCMGCEYKEQGPCEDVVSRQAVIDCFKKWQPYMATRLHEFEKELFSLPSVNPYQATCEEREKGECPYYAG